MLTVGLVPGESTCFISFDFHSDTMKKDDSSHLLEKKLQLGRIKWFSPRSPCGWNSRTLAADSRLSLGLPVAPNGCSVCCFSDSISMSLRQTSFGVPKPSELWREVFATFSYPLRHQKASKQPTNQNARVTLRVPWVLKPYQTLSNCPFPLYSLGNSKLD